MFGNIKTFVDKETKLVSPVSFAPVVIEGMDIIEQICPINPLTNKRSSVLEALGSVVSDPKKRYLVDELIKELPSIRNNPNMDDEDRIAVLSERLETGTPFEDEQAAERLSEISDVLFRGSPQAVKPAVQDVVKPLENSPVVPSSEAAPVSE